MEQFGTKDLYKVVIRATYNMKVGNREIVAKEPLLYLEKAQLFAVSQGARYKAARGGRGNLAQIIWESGGDVIFSIQQGVMSPIGFALLTNLQVLDLPVDSSIILTKTEVVEVDSYGKANLSNAPAPGQSVFIYSFENKVIQEKLTSFSLEGDVISLPIEKADTRVIVDYSYAYGEPAREHRLGKDRFNGYLSMEARYYTKGESGTEYTNILYVPKMKIISDIDLRVGENVAGPTLSTFNIVAMAEKINGEDTVMRLLQLGEDVDGL